ncbi:MAG TPA: hypothetical protein VHC47_13310, partial [Mucilaginibacter sp.]|nr:hypothetical protein [Mucilaginibacter sp.]
MRTNDQNKEGQRRTFLKQFATGAAVLGSGILASPLATSAMSISSPAALSDADEWFNQIKGKHRMIFDVPQSNGMMPFAWPKIFLLTNAATGTPEKDCSAVVILRHQAIPYAMGNELWEKYKFGEM